MRLRMRVWLESDGGYLMGDGRAKLLRMVEREGSLSAAARRLGMSYARAHAALKRLQRRLGLRLLRSRPGGRSTLTEDARALLAAWDRFRESLERSARRLRRRHLADGILRLSEEDAL